MLVNSTQQSPIQEAEEVISVISDQHVQAST